MSSLAQIPIRVESADRSAATGTIGGGVSAILNEIATRLELLAEGGEPAAIDFRSLPMSPDDRDQLLAALGSGEVTVTLEADGASTIRETGIPGVWWSEYRDRDGAPIAEFIEVARVPAILPAALDDLRRGAVRLRDRVAGAHPDRA